MLKNKVIDFHIYANIMWLIILNLLCRLADLLEVQTLTRYWSRWSITDMPHLADISTVKIPQILFLSG